MEYSQTRLCQNGQRRQRCLNPYSNGILTDGNGMKTVVLDAQVLILILMEYSQTSENYYQKSEYVLILILMEYSQTGNDKFNRVFTLS